ncbi:MAG: BolA family protein [Azospirillaceae bacterium]
MSGTPIADRIRDKLSATFVPSRLEVVDDSHRHRGHAGHDPRGESHFSVLIVSPRFEGVTRVQRQRLVYDLLAEELADRVHALSLTTLAPAEAAARDA